MKIDSHQHFWEYNPVRDSWIDDSMQVIRKDFLANELEIVLDSNGIDGSVAVQADQSEEETAFLLKLAQENDFIKAVVGWVNLCADNITDRLGHFSENRYFKGVRHIVQAESEDFVLRKDFQRGISKLAQFDLTYDILVYPTQLKNVIQFVHAFPEQKFVLDHIAKPNIKQGEINKWRSHINELARYENVYCKVSGLVTEADWQQWKTEDFTPYLDVVFEAFGIKRVMYGSDWPVCLLAGNYNEVLDMIKKYIQQFSKEEKNLIMGSNACHFYGLT